MDQMRKNSKAINRLIEIQIALSILFSGSAIGFAFQGNSAIYLQGVLFFFSLLTLTYKFRGRIPIYRNKSMSFPLSVLLIVVGSSILNISSFTPTVTGRCNLAVFQAFALLYCFDSGEDAVKAFVKVIRFFAITGVVFWILFVVCNIPYTGLPILSLSSKTGITYHSFFIYNIMLNSYRNCGPFWEPSIYAGFLMMGLVCSKFFLKQKSKSYLPFIIAVLSSQSSGGIAMLFVFFIVCLWDSNRENKSNSLLIKLFVISIMFVCVFFWDSIQLILLRINNNVFSKLINASNQHDSETRIMSFIVDFRIWIESPIFGVGVSEMEKKFLIMRDIVSKITNMAHTSTTSEYVAAFGVGGIWINYLWVKGLVEKNKSVVFNCGIILIFLVMLNEAPQINFVLTYFILFALVRFRYTYSTAREISTY
ncbi:MAG: hypothetical protein ACLS9A_08975 [Clostridia bacterium]